MKETRLACISFRPLGFYFQASCIQVQTAGHRANEILAQEADKAWHQLASPGFHLFLKEKGMALS